MTAPSTLDWFGCATFRLRTAGLVVMLDAYVDRAEGAAGPQPPVTADDIDECDWILVGHAHFDHLWGAERIAARTGATIVGSYETVRVMEAAGVPLAQMIPVAGGETIALGGDDGGVQVRVVPSQHSCVWSHGQMDQPDVVCLGDLDVDWHERQRRFGETMAHVATETTPEVAAHVAEGMVGHSDRGDGGALVFVIECPDGSLLFQDTSGHWTGLLRELPPPDVAILAAAGRGCIDGEPIQGSLAQFMGRQVDLLRPRRVILSHHDNWMPGFSVPTDTTPIRGELARVAPGTELVEPGYVDGTPLFIGAPSTG